MDHEVVLIIILLDHCLGLLHELLHLPELVFHIVHFYIHPLHFTVIVFP